MVNKTRENTFPHDDELHIRKKNPQKVMTGCTRQRNVCVCADLLLNAAVIFRQVGGNKPLPGRRIRDVQCC